MASVFFIEDIFNRLSMRWLRLLSFAIMTILVALFFGKYLLDPTVYSLAQVGDDYKNYFALKTYLDQPAAEGYFHYSFMNYPFGETIYFTDNSPSIAIVLKWLKNMFGCSSLSLIFVFDLIMIANFLVAGQLIISILKRFVSSNLLIIALSIALPFTNPQAFRMFLGTENLGLSAVILFSILQAIRIAEVPTADIKRLIVRSVILIIVIVLSSFIHLYYLLLTLFFVFPFLLSKGIKQYSDSKRAQLVLVAFAIGAISFIIVQFIITATDPYFLLRKDGANGFGWEPWKLSFISLYSPYDWSFSSFLISSTQNINYESFCYLGPIALYGVLLFGFISFFLKTLFSNNTEQQNSKKPDTLVYWIFLISLVSFFVSLGKEYYLMNGEYVFRNYLNITYFADYFTNKFTHFRCLGRFSWVFFWSVNFVAALWLDKLLRLRKILITVFIYFLIYIAVEDALHTGYQYRSAINPNTFNAAHFSSNTKEIKSKAVSHYDAMIVLPFFQTGSEDYPNTIDPTIETQKCWMELSNALQTPMLSFMMSRTPLNFNKAQLNFYRTAQFDSIEAAKMEGKSVLIIKNESFYAKVLAEKNNCSDTTIQTIELSKTLPDRLGLQPFDSVGEFKLYSWTVPRK